MQTILINEDMARSLLATLESAQQELKRLREQGTGKEPMTKTEAAKYLKVARSTLDDYINQGAIAVSRFGGRVWITRASIDTFIEAHTRTSRAA